MARLISTTALLILPAIFGLLMPLCIADNILYSDSTLYASQSLSWGSYSFTMQTDCDLVLYDDGNPVWTSGTSGKGSGCYLRMQTDGNLVVYNYNGTSVWETKTGGQNGNFLLVLQADRNVVIYGPAIWSTDTTTVGVGVTITKSSTKNSTSESLNVVGGGSDQNIAMVTN